MEDCLYTVIAKSVKYCLVMHVMSGNINAVPSTGCPVHAPALLL